MFLHLTQDSSFLKRVAVSVLFLIGLVSCDANEFSIQVRGVVKVDPMSCLPIDSDDALLSRGTVDVVMADQYAISLSMRNVLQNSLDVNGVKVEDGRLNTTDISIKKAIVRYLDPDEVGLALEEEVREIPFGGLLPSSSTKSMIQTLTVLESSMIDILRLNGVFKGVNATGRLGPVEGQFTLLLGIRIQGETLDGRTVESNEITFPVEVCMGCRVLKLALGDEECPMMSSEEQALVSTCPQIVGRDQNYASCGLCTQLAFDSVISSLCYP